MHRPAKEPCACGSPKSQVAKTCWDCRRNQVHSNCEICGTSFRAKVSKGQRTCSERCAYDLRGRLSAGTQSRKVALVCEWCDKSRLVSPSSANRRFCSAACGYAANSGQGSAQWQGGITSERAKFDGSRGWVSAKKRVWDRDGSTCQRCGSRHDKSKRTFEVHHITPFRYRDLRLELGNLILLCVGCHKWVHSKRNTERRFIRTPD